MIGTDKLVFDPLVSPLDENSNVGAWLRAADGTLITKTTDGSKERLDVNTGAEHNRGSAAGSTDRGMFALAVDDAGNYAPLKVNSSGELLVDVTVTTGADKAEDSAHVSGDIGSYVLAVRQDTLSSSVSADGDYASFKVDSLGALWTRLSQIPAADAPNTAFSAQPISVSTTAIALPTSPLAARKKIVIQNLGNKAVFVGASSVTAADGIRIAAGGNWETEAGPAIALYAISSGGTQDVRVYEIA